MMHASLIARVNFARSSAMGKIRVVPTTTPLAPPPRLQFCAFILTQDTRRLPQNRSLMCLAARKPQAFCRGLVPPPAQWSSAVLPPQPHQSIVVAKPRDATSIVAFEARTTGAGTEPKFQHLAVVQRRALWPPNVTPIGRHGAPPAVSSTPSAVQL